MKKVLLLSLGLVMGLCAFAQEAAVKRAMPAPIKVTVDRQSFGTEVVESSVSNFPLRGAQSVVTNEGEYYYEAEAMYTTFDNQSNSFVSNRMAQFNDGSVAITATMSNEEYDDSFPDRGTGYNFSKGGIVGEFGEIPETRIEDFRTGWPTIAPYGAEGEILVNHTEGLNYWIREKAGEGEWDGPYTIPNPTKDEFPEIEEGMKLAWPRIVTTGENNDVLHIFAAAQGDSTIAQFYVRSTDLENFEIKYSPAEMDELHINAEDSFYSYYTADDYAVSANGDNIAVVYCSGLFTNVMLYESNDAGLTWESRMVWESPTHKLNWETDKNSLFQYLYAPTHASVAIGKDGVSHVALGVGVYSHTELGGSYSLYPGITTDGVAYWNDTTCFELDENDVPVPSPIRSSQDDSLKHALRLWWDDPNNDQSIVMDITNFCAWMPPHPEEGYNAFDYNSQYTGSDGGQAGDYMQSFGLTAYPSIAVDPAGNLAVAYSSPDMTRLYQNTYYYRTIYVNYKPADSAYWWQMPLYQVNLYSDFLHTSSEATFISAVSTPVHENEFWFSCLSDDTPGFYSGASGSQANITISNVDVFKFNPTLEDWNEESIEEAIDVVYNIFPNPATDFINVKSSSDANATVSFANIAGQTVKVVNTNLTTGNNTIAISDLTTGVYFCTVTANGFSHTSKVVVK